MEHFDWTYPAMLESVATSLADAPCFIQDDKVTSWAEFDRQADALAARLLALGLQHQSKVAVYSTNRPEFMVAYHAAMKAGLAPYNVNFRYSAEEIDYLLDNGDAEAVVFEERYLSIADEVRQMSDRKVNWICITDEGSSTTLPDWVIPYNDVIADTPATRPVTAPWGRSGEDIFMIYTGGTTGMPKGVMWRQADMIGKGNYGGNVVLGIPPLGSPAEAGPRAAAAPIRPSAVIAPPLMHGTGFLTALTTLTSGGTVLLLSRGGFSADEVWGMVDTYKATRMTIVGQPFAQPLLEVLDANPGRWDVSSMMVVTSSGAMWNQENKHGLLKYMPQAMMVDAFSSSEALGLGSSITTAGNEVKTARFEIGEDCACFTEEGERVVAGSGVRGKVAVGGFIPLGYYKDEAKTASTFVMIEGKRWSMPGDWAEVEADGSLILLGRGSQCINTGGEKVFPEEVEEVLKRHVAIRDSAVAGIPHPRFGEQVIALVEFSEGAERPDQTAMIDHVKEHLAGYKAPRQILVVDEIPRAPNGKMDYKTVKEKALDAFGQSAA